MTRRSNLAKTVRSRVLAAAAASLILGTLAAGCGTTRSSATPSHTSAAARPTATTQPAPAVPTPAGATASSASTASSTSAAPPAPKSHPVGAPRDTYPPQLLARWQVMARVGGRPALWIAMRSGVTLVRIDQQLAQLALHAGTADPGGSGWRYGAAVAGNEVHHLILGFNGGFKFSTGSGGFESFGHIAVPLQSGVGSIVTYRDGATQIGAWGSGVPQRGRPVASVRQNLPLLIDHGVPNPSVTSCGAGCWGATIGPAAVARSGLGIRSDGQLLWAAGEGLTVSQLAGAMAGAEVQRAVQLDINPDWVAGYLYVHHATAPVTPVPVVPGQYGIYGHLLIPYARDFFTVLAVG